MIQASRSPAFLTSKVALITGSTSGIGLACARALAGAGADIVIHGLVTEHQGEVLAQQLASEFSVRCVFVGGDLTEDTAVKTLIETTQGLMGGLDILVNNAGIQYTARIEHFPIDCWRRVLDINLTSCFLATSMALPIMQANHFGRIINIASVHGLVASKEKAAYVAAKHGLVGLTKVTALENAEFGITCNAICPGWVDTAIVAAQISAKAAEQGLDEGTARRQLVQDKQPMPIMTATTAIGDLVVFLCSNSGTTITGAALPIDGGWTAQ